LPLYAPDLLTVHPDRFLAGERARGKVRRILADIDRDLYARMGPTEGGGGDGES